MFGLADIIQIQERIIYNHGQKSLGQSEHNFNSMRFTRSVAKSSAVFLQIHVPSPLLTQYNRDLKIRRRQMSTTASGSWKYLPAHFR